MRFRRRKTLCAAPSFAPLTHACKVQIYGGVRCAHYCVRRLRHRGRHYNLLRERW